MLIIIHYYIIYLLDHHWTELTQYTYTYVVASCCVFSKQLYYFFYYYINLRNFLNYIILYIEFYRIVFAEFIKDDSLIHLSHTCVGLWYSILYINSSCSYYHNHFNYIIKAKILIFVVSFNIFNYSIAKPFQVFHLRTVLLIIPYVYGDIDFIIFTIFLRYSC